MVQIQAVHVNDEPDEPTSMDYTPTVADISHEELSGFVTPESRVAHRDRMTPAQRVAVMLEEDLRAAQTPQMREVCRVCQPCLCLQGRAEWRLCAGVAR